MAMQVRHKDFVRAHFFSFSLIMETLLSKPADKKSGIFGVERSV